MKSLKSYTEEEVYQESNELRSHIKSKGWDDSVLYHFEAFTPSYRKALELIFDNTEVFTPDHFNRVMDKPVKSFGLGVSFGGVILTGTPNMDALLEFLASSRTKDPDVITEINKTLKELIDHGPAKAEIQATKTAKKLSRLIIPDVWRVFYRVHIPVKFVD